MNRRAARGLGSLLMVGSLALTGCSASSGAKSLTENTYAVQDDSGGEFSIRITFEDGAQNDLQLGLYYLSHAKLDGMNPAAVTSLQSDNALQYVSLWADSDGDAHITREESSRFCKAAHYYSQGSAIPPEFQKSLRRQTSKNGVIGSKR